MSENFINAMLMLGTVVGSILGLFALLYVSINLCWWFNEHIAPRLTRLITTLLDNWIEQVKKDFKQ